MAELTIGAIALIPPLISFISLINKVVDDFRKTEEFMNDRRNQHRLSHEICAWKIMIADCFDSQVTASASESQIAVMLKKNVKKHVTNLKEIKKKFLEYYKSETPYKIIEEVQGLIRRLRKDDIEQEIRKWMEALSCSRISNINRKVDEIRKLSLQQLHSQDSMVQTNSEVKNLLLTLVCLLTDEHSTLIFPDRLKVINHTVEDLQGSLRQCSTMGQTSDTDSHSGSDLTTDNESPHTADTTLHDAASRDELDMIPAPPATRNCPDYADRSSSPINFEAERRITSDAPYPVAHRSSILYHGLYKLSFSYKINDKDLVNTDDGNHVTSVGCFERLTKRGQRESRILVIDQRDWDGLYRLGVGMSLRHGHGMVSLDIELPARRLDYLQRFGIIMGRDAIVRRFSAVIEPIRHMLNKIQVSGSTLFRSAAHQPTKIFHWNLANLTSRDQVYLQLAELQARQRESDSSSGIVNGSGVPQLGSATVCVTLAWKKYRAWAKGNEPDSVLDALYEQGIVATLPLFTRQEREIFTPHIWCETETVLGDITASNAYKKTVHAIIQEYTYPGLLHDNTTAYDSIATRFFVVIFRTGDQDEWVDFTQSVESLGYAGKIPVVKFGA